MRSARQPTSWRQYNIKRSTCCGPSTVQRTLQRTYPTLFSVANVWLVALKKLVMWGIFERLRLFKHVSGVWRSHLQVCRSRFRKHLRLRAFKLQRGCWFIDKWNDEFIWWWRKIYLNDRMNWDHYRIRCDHNYQTKLYGIRQTWMCGLICGSQ